MARSIDRGEGLVMPELERLLSVAPPPVELT